MLFSVKMEVVAQMNINVDSSKPMRIHINDLASGSIPAMTPHVGGSCAEAASVCLENQKHISGTTTMTVCGDFEIDVALTWNTVTDQMISSHRDYQDATENGAYGIAALLVDSFTDMTLVEKSWKGTGFDYWLGEKKMSYDLFQNKAKLEVSGILCGTDRDVLTRTNVKLKQVDRSNKNLPAFIVVVEYNMPQSRVIRK